MQQVSEVAHDAQKIMIAPGSYFTWVYEDKPGSFGVLPLPELYMKQVIPMLANAGAKTIQTVYEGGPGKQCEPTSLEPLALATNMTIQGMYEMEAAPKVEDFLPIARMMSQPDQNPDVVITCTYDAACDQWIKALREVDWSPKAQVFSICVGLESFSDSVGTDAEYLIGMSPWDRSLEIQDAIAGWTPEEYVGLFEEYTGRNAAYHAALGQATVSLLAQAIESADSTDYEAVSAAIQTQAFQTVFGTVSFDANGQNKMDLIATQYDANGTVNVVYPPDLAGADLVYPMPTWAQRDCTKLSPCNTPDGAYSGTCRTDGTCECANENEVPFGRGPTAACHTIPSEDMTYINPSLKILGYVFVAIQCTASAFFITWTYRYQDRTVVRLSQPIFLVFVAFGCGLMSLSTLPLAQEGGYRFERDPLTRTETDVPVDGVALLDVACMAFPWLLATGFSITFSALFAKIVRVRKIMYNAERFKRKKVPVRDVLGIMVIVMVVEFAVLLAWQLVAPLRWSREVIATSDLGYPTQSVGRCAADDPVTSRAFAIGLFAINFACILTALVLCYLTRQVKSELNEAKFVTASVISIFQVLLLVIPIAIIASDETSASFFVKSAATFIIGFAVTMFIFVPKLVNLHLRKLNINVSELFSSGRISTGSRYGHNNSGRGSSLSDYGVKSVPQSSLQSSRPESSREEDSKLSLRQTESKFSGIDSGSLELGGPLRKKEGSSTTPEPSFNDFLVELLKFKTEEGHCRVPRKKGGALGRWVRSIRKEYHKLHPVRVKIPDNGDNGTKAPAVVDVTLGGDDDQHGLYFAGAYGRSIETDTGDRIEVCWKNAETVPENIRLDLHRSGDKEALASDTGRFDRVRLLNSLGFEWDDDGDDNNKRDSTTTIPDPPQELALEENSDYPPPEQAPAVDETAKMTDFSTEEIVFERT